MRGCRFAGDGHTDQRGQDGEKETMNHGMCSPISPRARQGTISRTAAEWRRGNDSSRHDAAADR
jgi:hypothetical protein